MVFHQLAKRTRGGEAALCLIAVILLLTACPGNGGSDHGYGGTYGGSSPSGGSVSFDDVLRYSNSGDTDALVRLFTGGSGGSGGEAGSDVVTLSVSDIRLPAGGEVTLSITGGVEDYEETATASDDGMVYFQVPRQIVGSEITVSLVVKSANGICIWLGKKTQLVDEDCQFSITLSREFVQLGGLYVCVHEVTQGEYETYCGYGGTIPDSTVGVGSAIPVYHVAWYDALVYCNLRSMAEGLTPCYTIDGSTDPADWTGIVTGSGGKPCGPAASVSNWNSVSYSTSASGYRLPTEAEWKYAFRGGPANDGYTYSGSNTIGDVAWYADNSGGKAHEVKTKAPNSAGIYDMTGNVREFCWDTYPSDPTMRVNHGGSWTNPATPYCTIDNVGRYRPFSRAAHIGFRIVCNAG